MTTPHEAVTKAIHKQRQVALSQGYAPDRYATAAIEALREGAEQRVNDELDFGGLNDSVYAALPFIINAILGPPAENQ